MGGGETGVGPEIDPAGARLDGVPLDQGDEAAGEAPAAQAGVHVQGLDMCPVGGRLDRRRADDPADFY